MKAKNKKKTKKKSNKGLWLIGLFLIICILLLCYYFYYRAHPKEEVVTKVVDTIEGYDYTRDDRDGDLFKEYYDKLKTVLESEDIDKDEYAKDIAALYVIDLYTLNNKINKYDVGSVEYIYPDKQVEFKQKAMDTLYANMIDNSDGKREKEYPIVKSIISNEVTEDTYKMNEESKKAFVVTIKFDYEKENDYDSSLKITLVEKDKYLYIVEVEKIEDTKTSSEDVSSIEE